MKKVSTDFMDTGSAITSVIDTDSIDLTIIAQTLQADLVYQNSPSVTLTVPDALGLKAEVNMLGITHNLLSATHPDTLAASVVRGDIIVGNATPKWSRLPIGANGTVLASDGTDATWQVSALVVPAALTKVDDTNVTLTLGGTPATALLQATSLTLGWTGVLSLARGGTNKALTAVNGGIVWTDADSMEISVAGLTGQVLQSNGAAAPTWSTPTYPSASGTAGKILRSDGTNNVYSTATYPNTATTGDLIYASAANIYANLADVATGSVLASGGVGVAPSWQTLAAAGIVSGTGVAGQVTFWTGTNTIGGDTGFVYDSVTNYVKISDRLRVGSLVAPTQALDITGNALIAGHSAMGSGAILTKITLNVVDTPTEASAQEMVAVFGQNFRAGGFTNTVHRGGNFEVYDYTDVNLNTGSGGLSGVYSLAQRVTGGNSSSRTINYINGAESIAYPDLNGDTLAVTDLNGSSNLAKSTLDPSIDIGSSVGNYTNVRGTYSQVNIAATGNVGLGSSTANITNLRGVESNVTLTVSGGAGANGVINVTSLSMFKSLLTLTDAANASIAITTLRGLDLVDNISITSSPTITTWNLLDLPTTIPGAVTTAVTLNSPSTAHMRHTGNAMFGASATPNGVEIRNAVTETATGADNMRLGVLSSTPTLIFEDAGQTQWIIDNITGIMRFRHPGVNRLLFYSSTGFLGIGATIPLAKLNMSDDISAASWNISGIGIRYNAFTATDTSTAAAGTVALQVAHSLLAPTFAATNAINITRISTLHITEALQGANVTTVLANRLALTLAGSMHFTGPRGNITWADNIGVARTIAPEDGTNGFNANPLIIRSGAGAAGASQNDGSTLSLLGGAGGTGAGGGVGGNVSITGGAGTLFAGGNVAIAGGAGSVVGYVTINSLTRIGSIVAPTVALDVTGAVLISLGLLSQGATNGIGYTTGAGGTVTQATNKATGVTLNKVCGQITMNGAALAAAAEVSFVVTNSACATTDVPVVVIDSVGTVGAYTVTVSAVGAGSFTITLGNVSAGSLSEAVVLNFAIIKASTS